MFNKRSNTEQQLADARRRLQKASEALVPKHKGGEWEEYGTAHDEVLRLERALAKERNEPYAVPCDFPVRWDVGAPLPFLLQNDYRTFLTFYVSEPNPRWDGTEVKIVDPSSPSAASLCLVAFRSTSTKFGHPNDEVLRGHPLYGRGLESYTAQIVKNSPWLKEVAKTNSVHDCDKPEKWEKINHYVFWFHDSTFECLAESYTVELTNESMAELLTRVQEKLLE
jgi:hypothetical protein